MIEINLNGKKVKVAKNVILYDFLEEKFSSRKCFAIALNREFIPKTRYKEIVINYGDEIEIVSPHPGG